MTAAAALSTETITQEVVLVDRSGDRHPFVAEEWFNQRVGFLMLVPRRLIPRGRRLKVVTQ